MVSFNYKMDKIIVILICLLGLEGIWSFASYALTPQEEMKAKIEYLEKKRKVINDSLTEFKSLKKQYDKSKAESDKLGSAYKEASDKVDTLQAQLADIRTQRNQRYETYGTARKVLDRVIPTSVDDFKATATSVKLMAKIEYYQRQKDSLEDKYDGALGRTTMLEVKISNLRKKVLEVSDDPKKFMVESQAELNSLYGQLEGPDDYDEETQLDLLWRADAGKGSGTGSALSDAGVSADYKGGDTQASASMFDSSMLDFLSSSEDKPVEPPSKPEPKKDSASMDKNQAPKFVALNKPKVKDKEDVEKPVSPLPEPDKSTTDSKQDKTPKFLENVDKTPISDSQKSEAAPEVSNRDDYRIVSIAAETEPVEYGKQVLQKLKSIDNTVIIIEIRDKQHIVEGQEAVSILVEKGMFRNFPGIGLVSTTKYAEFGGYNKDYSEGKKKGQAEEDECGAKLQACYAKWGEDSIKSDQFYNKMSTEEYWARVMCAQLDKRCKMRQQEPEGGIDFDKGFKRTPMSKEDAKLFGAGILGKDE